MNEYVKWAICVILGFGLSALWSWFYNRQFSAGKAKIPREERQRQKLLKTQRNIGNRIYRAAKYAVLKNHVVTLVVECEDHPGCGYWITVRRYAQIYPERICQVYINLFDNTQVCVSLENRLDVNYNPSEKDVMEVIHTIHDFVAGYSLKQEVI